MSLSQRIARSLREDDDTSPPPPLLPLDAVQPFLKEHALVRAMRLAPRDVHAAMVGLYARLHETSKASRRPSPPSVQSSIVARRCPHCEDGVASVLDAREGCEVCGSCGAVLTSWLNVDREFVQPAQDSWTTTNVPAVRGVAAWIVKSSAAFVVADEAQRPSPYVSELEHWNTYAHLGTDDIHRWDRVLRHWTQGAHSRDARLAAALLYDRLCIPEEEDVRRAVRKRQRLPTPLVPVPEPRFACAECGVRLHVLRDARFHCRRGGGRR